MTSGARPLTIAVLGPLTGQYAGSGKAMVEGARLQATRINARGGIDGRPVQIVTYDTHSDPDRARDLARKIAASDAVAAVGGYFSSVSVTAAPVLARQHMPAVTGSATAPRLIRHNPWYFRVVPGNDSKGRFSALYTDGVLNKHNVNIVYEADVDARLDRIVAALKKQRHPGALFVALLGEDSARLVERLRDAHIDVTVIGGDSVGLVPIHIRPEHRQSEQLRLVSDDIGMRRGQGASLVERANHNHVMAHSSAWHLSNLAVFSDLDSTRSTLGDPQLLRTGHDTRISYSRFNLIGEIKRLTRSYVISNLAPLFFVLLLGYAMLYVPVEGPPFTARINLGVLAMLTTVSFSLKTSRDIPEVSYLVTLDYLYYAVYILLLFGIASSIVKLDWVKRGYQKRVKRLEWIIRILLPLLLLSVVAVGLVLVR